MSELKNPERQIETLEKNVNVPPNAQAFELHKEKALSGLFDSPQLEKMRNEVPAKSKFGAENFRPENSFDAKAKQDYPELGELKSKYVYDVKPMGESVSDAERVPKGKYTPEEREYLQTIRDAVDAPTPETKMQKIIGVDTGNVKSDLDCYLEPKTLDGKKTTAQVFGYVAKAEDSVPFTHTPQECFDNLRLDYKDTPYKYPDKSVYVVRFTDGDNYAIPYGKQFGGESADLSPNTENGFVAAKDVSIPEYKVAVNSTNEGALVTDGEIYRINPNGTEDVVARFNAKESAFELIDKEDK